MSTRYKKVESIREFIDAIRLRVDVFIKEQGFPVGWEPDEDDKTSTHFIALSDGVVVATARLRETGKGECKVERMAVRKDHRGKGVGRGLLSFMLRGLAGRIWLRSQVQSQKFYEKCGFGAVSKPYDLYGCPHIDMELSSEKTTHN